MILFQMHQALDLGSYHHQAMEVMKHADPMFPHDTLAIWLDDEAAVRRHEVFPLDISIMRQVHVLAVDGEQPGLGKRINAAKMRSYNCRPPILWAGCVRNGSDSYHDSKKNEACN